MKLLGVLLFISSSLAVFASNVLELDESNFDQYVGAGKPPALVEFYAPWCGHCKNLAPIYEQLGDAYAHAKDKVQIVKVDADGKGKSLGGKYGVSGFPTLKWFSGDDSTPEVYNGARELDDLAAFVAQKSGVKAKIKPPPPSAVTTLDVDNFNNVVMDPSNDVLVAFTAPWCGHCKSMKPILESVARNFAPETHCVIANLDADAAHNKGIAGEYEVTSYPTIKFFPRSTSASSSSEKGKKIPTPYEGGRSEADFVQFLNEHCGTNRAVGGGLNDLAGLVPQLESHVLEFFAAAGDKKQKIIASVKDEVSKLKQDTAKAGAWYVRALEKSLKDGEAWVEKEHKRLSGILLKRTLSSNKLDEIKVKINVLNSFLKQKAEKVKEKVKGEL